VLFSEQLVEKKNINKKVIVLFTEIST